MNDKAEKKPLPAGLKPIDDASSKTTITVMIDPELAAWYRKQPKMERLIEKVLANYKNVCTKMIVK